ncbi:MAG TPA: hypothetical protein VKC35_08515 [Vicinamibacterales bacterium]|nr:hypothetical protein [Vicinamibacterales bacterium]
MKAPAETASLAAEAYSVRHQDLVEEILSGDAMRIAGAVREHFAVGRRHTLELLEPYFSTSSQRFSRIVAARPT